MIVVLRSLLSSALTINCNLAWSVCDCGCVCGNDDIRSADKHYNREYLYIFLLRILYSLPSNGSMSVDPSSLQWPVKIAQNKVNRVARGQLYCVRYSRSGALC